MATLAERFKERSRWIKSRATAIWQRIRPKRPPAPPKEADSTAQVIAREKQEISESRAVRMKSVQEFIGQEILNIRRIFETHTASAAAGAGGSGGVYDARQIHEAERNERSRSRVFQPVGREVENNYVALCCSGGGIRSATFSLGVISALAKKGYLKQLDYLSTVSGGGYIGSWLSAWAKRAQTVSSGTESEPSDSSVGITEVERVLAQNRFGEDGRYLEPDPVRFLRKYSNYLAPRTGLLSTDLWALIAVYLRNVLLNLGLLVAAGALVLTAPLLLVRYGWLLVGHGLEPILLNVTRILLIAVMAAIAYSFASFSSDVQPTFKLAKSIAKRPGVWVVLPLLAAAASMTYVLTPELAQEKLRFMLSHPAMGDSALNATSPWNALPSSLKSWVLEGAIWYTAIWILGSFAARMLEVLSAWNWKLNGLLRLNWVVLFGRRRVPQPVAKGALGGSLISVAAAAVSGGLGGLLLYAFRHLLLGLPQLTWPQLPGHVWVVQLYAGLALRIILGPPLLLWTAALVSVLHVGLLGRNFPDAKREWLSRMCAMLALTAAAWAILMSLSLYGAVVFKFLFLSPWAKTTFGRILKWIVASGWLAATVGGVIGGNRSKTKPQGVNESPSLLLKLAPPIFIGGLLLMLSFGVDWFLRTTPFDSKAAVAMTDPSADQYKAMINNTKGAASVWDFMQRFADSVRSVTPPSARAAIDEVGKQHWLYAAQYLSPPSSDVLHMLLGVVCVVLVLSWRLDVNEFSIHLLYRNRLARCYLGASRLDRRPQPFTGFDLKDDLPVSSLVVHPEIVGTDNNQDINKPYYGPYHIVCTALNLVSGKELAWQTRKARSFIYSPFYCGYDFFGDGTVTDDLANCAYRHTDWYSGYPGPYLGTALAISGAAATPNMGYHSSPALTFLMTVFNVRLGWWAGNTRHNKTWLLSGPRWMLYLLKELFGRTDDESRFVYLSDGGHFENLGLYELVRRKCRYIIAVDGGCDPDYSFSDLGNAIQKCRRDLGTEILIDVSNIRPKNSDRFCERHYAVGNIKYSDGVEGTLLYLKSSLTTKDRRDVQSFAEEDGAFPHDSTADQFFNETRFESFRALGEDVLGSVLRDVTDKLEEPPATLAGLFTALEQIYSKTAPTRSGRFDLDEVQVAKMKFSFETE